MISLTCTHCKQVLKIDDGFAGGVCRCQHCGTIQTVPTNLREGPSSGAVASAAGKTKPQKALFQHKSKSGTNAPVQGSGLDELAQIVASSGLSGSGLTRGGLRTNKSAPKVAKPKAMDRKKVMIIAGGVVGVVLCLVVVLIVMSRGGDDGTQPLVVNTPSVRTPSGTPAPTRTNVSGPSFVGMPLAGKSVVYVLDRGTGTREAFSDLLEATFKSIESLGPDRQFQILFWDNGTDPLAFPVATMISATPANVQEARTKLQDAYAFGQSSYESALKKGLDRAPASLVLATGKAFELDDAFATAVGNGSGVKVYILAINGPAESKLLQQVAQKTGGAYTSLSTSELRALNQ